MVPKRSGSFEGHDGTQLYFEEYGEGPPLILANGIVCSIEPYWQLQIPHLAQHGRVIAWDYRGHGRSNVPEDLEASGIEDHARDLLCLMDHLDIESAVLTGHSMGVQVILETYLKAPERASGLIALAGTYGKPFSTFYGNDLLDLVYDPLLRWAREHHRPIALGIKLLARTPIPQIMARSGGVHWYLAPWEMMNAYFEHCFNLDVPFALTAMRRLGDHSAEDALERIDVPTLVIAGAKDPFTPVRVLEEMHRRIDGSEMLTIANGTHVPQIEHPELVNLRIQKFLEDHALVEPERPAASRKRRKPAAAKARQRTSHASGTKKKAPAKAKAKKSAPPKPRATKAKGASKARKATIPAKPSGR